MEYNITILIVIMALAGLGGGTVNYMLSSTDKQKGWGPWCRCIIVGIGASFLMPLFLNTISSTLVPTILKGEGNT